MKATTIVLVILATVAVAIPPAAAQSRGMTPEDYFAFKSLSDVRLSPDGSAIVFVIGNATQTAYMYPRACQTGCQVVSHLSRP